MSILMKFLTKSPLIKPRVLPLISSSRYASTLVLGEHENGHLKQSSLSAVEAASRAAIGNGEENSISVLLSGSGESLQKAVSHAATSHPSISQVLVADTDKLAHPLAEPWAALIHLIQQRGGYSHIIAASSSFGKNVLPRAAALLDVSPITDVIDISGPKLFVRPIYAGNALCTVRYTGVNPCMITIRSTSFLVPLNPADSKSEAAPISQVDLSTFSEDSVGKSRYVKHTSQDTERVDLGSARVVITGGRALKSAENFQLIEKLAEKLGGAEGECGKCRYDSPVGKSLVENNRISSNFYSGLFCIVGATRAAVDAGFVPNELQVGQTGKIVAPELYMAFGVSGAIQHLAGMRDSKVIVAVNKDADAPIFQVADYGLVADIFEAIPELLEKLPSKK